MSAIAVRMAAGAPSVIALAGFSGQLLANRNVNMAEMLKHTLRMLPSLGLPLFRRQLVYQLGPLAFNNGPHLLFDHLVRASEQRRRMK